MELQLGGVGEAAEAAGAALQALTYYNRPTRVAYLRDLVQALLDGKNEAGRLLLCKGGHCGAIAGVTRSWCLTQPSYLTVADVAQAGSCLLAYLQCHGREHLVMLWCTAPAAPCLSMTVATGAGAHGHCCAQP